MSCQCQSFPNPPCAVTVSSASVVAGAYTLVTDFDLSTLTANADFTLIVDPGVLGSDTGNDPVVLSDGTTDLDLEMYNGNNMRENTLKPLVRRRSRCGRAARLRCFYGNDPAHVLVRPTRRY